MAGGISGEFEGCSYFECDPGHGLLLPYDRLKKDDRFSDEPTPPRHEAPKASLSASQLTSTDRSPAATTDENLLFKQFFNALGTSDGTYVRMFGNFLLPHMVCTYVR